MAKRIKETVECEGRFSELRNFLYGSAIPLALGDKTTLNEEDLNSIWDLCQEDIVSGGFDCSDPYYYCNSYSNLLGTVTVKGTDCLRETPNINAFSLIPLIESHIYLEPGLVSKYLLSMNISEAIAGKLEVMAEHPERYFRSVLKREPKEIVFPGGKNLSGYKISANFGIGTISSGSLSGGGIRSDSPFILEVYQETGRRGEYDLAAVIGFWSQKNEMIISQMQSGRNAQFPEGVLFGVGGLRVAEVAAERIGFEKVLVYSANTHPYFRQYAHSGDSMKKDFACIFDGSAKKLGYNGTRCSSYEKLVGNGLNHTC